MNILNRSKFFFKTTNIMNPPPHADFFLIRCNTCRTLYITKFTHKFTGSYLISLSPMQITKSSKSQQIMLIYNSGTVKYKHRHSCITMNVNEEFGFYIYQSTQCPQSVYFIYLDWLSPSYKSLTNDPYEIHKHLTKSEANPNRKEFSTGVYGSNSKSESHCCHYWVGMYDMVFICSTPPDPPPLISQSFMNSI